MLSLLRDLQMRYKNSPLQSKLFLSYFVLIFLPIVALSLFSYQKSSDVIVSQTLDISSLYLSQASNKISAELEKMSTLSQIISQNIVIREFLEKKDKNISFSEEFDDASQILETISDIKLLHGVEQVRLYIDSSFMHSRSHYILYNLADIKNEPWYQNMIDNHISTIIRAPFDFKYPLTETKSIISVTTLMRSYSDIEDIIGVVSIDMLASQLVDIIKSADFTQNGAVVLTDKSGAVLAQSNNMGNDLNDYTGHFSEINSLYPDRLGIMSSGEIAIGISNPLMDGLRLYSLTSMHSMLTDNLRLKWQLVVFALILGVVVYFMAYFYSKFYTKRVKDLAELMHKTEKGDFHVKCIVDSADEIGELQASFNFMTKHINSLLNERYNLGKCLKDTELKALQAQINPHFLYNTLDLISWKAKKANNAEINDIVCKMANFYQISLSNGSDFIKLSEEFKHITLYIELQNLRFEKKVLLEAFLQPELSEIKIMKLLLQPIVENSLSHGIMNSDKDTGGVIRIRAYVDAGYISISISDNGDGMSKKRVVEILSHDRSRLVPSNDHGFGLLNIIDRLKLYYDNDYIFDIDSTRGVGTIVNIKIPYNPDSKK